MATINFQLELKDYIECAGKALEENKPFMVLQNLSDAMKIAKDKEEKGIVYKCYADMYNHIAEINLARNMLFRACIEIDKGNYYCLDFTRFFPEDVIIEEEEQPLPYGDVILGYNDAYNCFKTADFEKGFDILCTLPPDLKSLDEIMILLNEILDKKGSIDLRKHSYKLLVLAGIYASRSGEFVRLLLQGGEETRLLMTEGVEILISAVEDKRVLIKIGQAFFREGEFQCAKACFEEVVKENPIDVTALFYLATISRNEGDRETFDNYFSKFLACVEHLDAPVEFLKNYIYKDADNNVDNQTLLKADIDYFKSPYYKKAFFEEYKEKLRNLIYFDTDSNRVLSIVKGIKVEYKDEVFNLYKSALISPFVESAHKPYIIGQMVDLGYEGRIAVAYNERGIITDIVKLHYRGTNVKYWKIIYNEVLVRSIASQEFLVLNPNMLGRLVKMFAKSCEQKGIVIEETDVDYLCEIFSCQYVREMVKGTNISPVRISREISSEKIKNGLKKFPPSEVWF